MEFGRQRSREGIVCWLSGSEGVLGFPRLVCDITCYVCYDMVDA